MNANTSPILPENLFQLIFEKSPGSLLIQADPPGFVIIAASDSYLISIDKTRDAIIGKSFFEVFPDDGNDFEEDIRPRSVFAKVIESRQKVDVLSYRFDVYNADTNTNEIHYWSCSNTPIFVQKGKVAYILNTVIDITAEVQAKDAAIESENRLRIATEATALATWDLDLNNQSFIYSPRLVEIFGHPAGTDITLAHVRNQLSADDMQNIVVKAYFEALVTNTYLYEVRISWPDGSLHWIKTQGIVLRDDKKNPARMLGTILDITESKRDEIRKNDFIAMASHELKTPLTSIKAYLQLLAKKLDSSEDSFITTAILKAGYQVNKMADLIHGFLDLSKLESGKLKLNVQEFDINKLIEEVISEVNLISAGNRIYFNPQEEAMVNADKEKIEQVINNFLSNAIKYSDKGSIINIYSTKIDNHIMVSITDEGIGINAKDQEKLFQRFYRVESEKMKNISGFGIGLYLSSEIIQRHNGKVWVQSDTDKGSTFYFSLPLNK